MTQSKKTFKDNLSNPAMSFISEASLQGGAKQTGATPEGYKVDPRYIETKSKRVQLLLQPSTYEKLKERAKEQGTSMNNLANILLLGALDGVEKALKEITEEEEQEWNNNL